MILSLLIIILIQFRLTYLSYVFSNKNLDVIFFLNVLFSLFSIVVVAFWFTPTNNKEYSSNKENLKVFSRKDFTQMRQS